MGAIVHFGGTERKADMTDHDAFEAYIAPARARSGVWRVTLGIVLVAVFWFGLAILLLTALSEGWLEPVGLDREIAGLFEAEGRVMPPVGVFVFLLTFLGAWIGLWVVLRLLHRRPFGTLYHPSRWPQARNVLAGALLSLVFQGIGILAYIAVLGPPERTELGVGLWAIWLVPIVLGIVMQATSEELMFRGYILQQFAVWSRNPLVWAVLPALIFTALHVDGSLEPGMLGRMLVHIGMFGLIMAALVWRTGGLGAAIGLHVMNNIVAFCLFGIEGAAFGFELWVFGPDTLTRMFAFDLATGIAMLGVAVFLFPRGRRSAHANHI